MIRTTVLSVFLLLPAVEALARVTISPYVAVTSKKKNKSARDGTESEKIVQTQTYGLRATIGIYRIFKFQLGIGQARQVSTEKVTEAVDEFDEIDFQDDFDLSTDDPDNEVKITEVRNRARLSLLLDPSFSIFIIRTKAGVQATQRLLTVEETGKEKIEKKPPPTYKPFASAGLGIRIARNMQAMAEYSFFFYKFPDLEPFEREVSISYGISF